MIRATTSTPPSLPDREWKTRYRSATSNILHDFYIPALSAARQYDRIAGYFRSTSLAIASQGFSAMIRHGGRIRLVVGADLAPDDVRAVIEHDDRQRLAQELIKCLGQPAEWSEAVSNGLGLLSWMVEQGFLEIRVALRKHQQTGEPIPMSSREDGYVHEKWAVFTDQAGNRLLVDGSLNESRTALVLNAENLSLHCDWWSTQDAERADEYQAEFQAIWDNEDPGISVLSLPEAVRQRLIAFAAEGPRPREVDGSSEAPAEAVEPSALEWLQFAILRDGPRMPNGRMVGMATAPVAPWPHQAVVARRLIESWPYSFLLCDEVGLGKTIEAGLALRSLILSGITRRVLIAPPASLAKQWQNELAEKFLLRFARAVSGPQPHHVYRHPMEEQFPARSLFLPDHLIVSTGLIRRKDRQKELRRWDWDIALVDEAHYARRSNSTSGTLVQAKFGDLYQALRETVRPHAAALWLATATPMQLDPIEVYDLFSLTRRVGPFQHDPSLTEAYYEVQGRIQRGERVSDDELDFLRRVMDSVKRHDPELAVFIRQTVLSAANRIQYDNWLERGIKPTAFSLKQLLRAIFASAPLSRVMMRHTRALLRIYQQQGKLSANLAHRHVLPMRQIQYTAREREAYDALESYSTELAQQVLAANDQQTRVATGFYLSLLQRRFASSLHAIAETLKRRQDRVQATLDHVLAGGVTSTSAASGAQTLLHAEDVEQDDGDAEAIDQLLKNRTEQDLRWELEELQQMLSSGIYDVAPVSSKMQVLLGYVEQRRDPDRPGRIGQMVVFTQFWDTLYDIVRRFRQVNARFLIGTYSGRGGQYTDPETGKMVGIERDEIKHRFLRGQIDILVCTDAAAEGLNLQTADYLVNFDLPWNPAKVEQRIGRIDRIGQRHDDIYVQNLCYLGSVEEIVYDRLLGRLGNMISVVGEQQLSMLPVTEEDFRRLAQGEVSEAQLEQEALQRIAVTERRSRETELSGQEVYEIYQRMAQTQAAEKLPVSLASIWELLSNSAYLKAVGCESAVNVVGDDREPLLLSGIPGVVDGTAMTIDRDLFDDGVESLGAQLRFASYGEPAFDALLELSEAWSPPACVRRIAIKPNGLQNDYVAYVVAVKDGDGSAARLITSLDELRKLELSEAHILSDEEVAPFEAKLQTMANREFKLSAHVDAIEADNERSAQAQAALALGAAYGLVTSRQKVGNADENFWKELDGARGQAEERIAHGSALRVMHIPSQLGAVLATGFVPFNVRQRVSDDSYWIERASPQLYNPAIDAATRVADGIKRKKSELSTDAGLERVRQEMEKRVAGR